MQPCRFLAAPLLVALAVLTGAPTAAHGAGPPVVVDADPGVDPGLLRRVREVVARRRSIRDDLALPAAAAVSPERAAMEQRRSSIRLALERAQRLESEAAWDGCVREAASALSDATLVLGKEAELSLLRDLHVQIGACMTLNQNEANARPHFIAAALLDESPIKTGLHREEAERAQIAARDEVLGRSQGKVRIETTPPGADVWIDGHRASGVTPLDVTVRLGDHFITTRRFRFEPHTERTVLQPSGLFRIALDPARRETLREQLGALGGAGAAAPPAFEVRLARAAWSRAEQVVLVRPESTMRGSKSRVQLLDALTGALLRKASVDPGDDEAALRRAVCEALGETCEAPSRGVPWYVWPLAGAVLVSGAITAAVVANNSRDFRLCPIAGCQ
jgi:hypothetical protein